MAYSLESERPLAAAPSVSLFAGVLAWTGKMRAARTQRVALATLLEFEEHRLADLGISRFDVLEALNNPAAHGQRLSAHRARSAASRPDAVTAQLYERGI